MPLSPKFWGHAIRTGASLLSHTTSTLDHSPQRHLGLYLGEINRNLAA